MKQIKWPLLFFAIAAATCIMGIGIAIGERSIIGVLVSMVALVFVMGFGFKTKKKMRESGEL
ncbi:YlaF family protein [Cytobacillus spongiae]|uniref:YlaF family protein n=1 Tax=Cytobacillus spongiae TaxID=2901381 RepID=UPI001F205CF2|nr:YlaF family protein [Cytobacillus spongiae]UII57261.1 YlaF family protein [Cytobacillus spongiae]